jgi:hypothetical protein
MQRLQRLARRFSDTSELLEIWRCRDEEDNCRRAFDKLLDQLKLHKGNQRELDRIRDSMRSYSLQVSINLAKYECICKELKLLEDGVRELLPYHLDLIPIVGESQSRPSDVELRSMAGRFRSLESRILTLSQDELLAAGTAGLSQTDSWSKPLTIKEWLSRFLLAQYSPNKSMKSFQRFVQTKLKEGVASRETLRGPIKFKTNLLRGMKVTYDK